MLCLQVGRATKGAAANGPRCDRTMARSASDREGHTSSLTNLSSRFCHPSLGRVGSWPSHPTWGCVPSANSSHVGKSIRTLNSSPIRFTMARLGMRATSGCLFWIMERESVQLAQCAALQPSSHWSTPDHVAVTCHRPPQPHSISPLGSKLQLVRSWISPKHDLCKRQNRTLVIPLVLLTSTLSCHPRLVENVPTTKPREGSPVAQLDDPLVSTVYLVSRKCMIVLIMPSTALFACSALPIPLMPSVSLVASLLATHHMSVGPIQQLSVRHRSVLSDVADPVTSQRLRVLSRPTHLADGHTSTKTVIYTNQCRNEVMLWSRFHEAVVSLNCSELAPLPTFDVGCLEVVLSRIVHTMLEMECALIDDTSS